MSKINIDKSGLVRYVSKYYIVTSVVATFFPIAIKGAHKLKSQLIKVRLRLNT